MTFLDRIQGIVSNIFIFQLLIFSSLCVFSVRVCERERVCTLRKIA